MNDLDIGVIGNSTFGALIDKHGRVVWACFPRFDGDPVFSYLLNGGGKSDSETGFFDIEVENLARAEQHYQHNTAILTTTLFDNRGAALEITDFAPRRVIVRLHNPPHGTEDHSCAKTLVLPNTSERRIVIEG